MITQALVGSSSSKHDAQYLIVILFAYDARLKTEEGNVIAARTKKAWRGCCEYLGKVQPQATSHHG